MQDNNFRIIFIDRDPQVQEDLIRLFNQKREPLFAMQDEPSSNDLFSNSYDFPIVHIDQVDEIEEGIKKIKFAKEMSNPYALAVICNSIQSEKSDLEKLQEIGSSDPKIQILICMNHGSVFWENVLKMRYLGDNLVFLKKPLDLVFLRQLAYVLARKWQLSQGVLKCEQVLNKLIDERAKTTKQSLSLLQTTLSKRSVHEHQLEFQATHDPLTHLPNRALLFDRISQNVANSNRQKNYFAILFLDLDQFKLVNDSFSHEYGDRLLRAIGKRLTMLVSGGDTLARFCGDEFVMVVSSLSKIEDAVSVAHKILTAFHKPFRIHGKKINISTSIGVSLYPVDGNNSKQLLRHADLAMYRAKEQGGAQFYFYTHALNRQSKERISLEAELRQAIANDEFFLLYQPQFYLEKEKGFSVEALIRWAHPKRGTILPLDFIPVAELSGLIVPIGEWVIEEACRQHQAWKKHGLPAIRIAINISTYQLRQPDFVSTFNQILQKYQVIPQYIDIEITENIILVHREVWQTINDLKELGVRIVIDNFGTSHSSLADLTKLRVDGLKIDASFVKNIAKCESDEEIIKAMVAMAKTMNFDVIAEGVETQTQIHFLTENKCDGIQGYHVSKPLPANTVTELFIKRP